MYVDEIYLLNRMPKNFFVFFSNSYDFMNTFLKDYFLFYIAYILTYRFIFIYRLIIVWIVSKTSTHQLIFFKNTTPLKSPVGTYMYHVSANIWSSLIVNYLRFNEYCNISNISNIKYYVNLELRIMGF